MIKTRSSYDLNLKGGVFLLFCSAAVTEAGKVGDRLSQDFFKEEYMLNNKIGKI